MPIDAATASEEERRRHSQRLERRRGFHQEGEDYYRELLSTPREEQFSRDLGKLAYEAQWMMQGVGFANGRPLNEQVPIRAQIILEFIRRMQAYTPKPQGKTAEQPDGRPQNHGGH